MNKLSVHGNILAAVETLERTAGLFSDIKQYGTDRLRPNEIAEIDALLKRTKRAVADIAKTLAEFQAIAEPVASSTQVKA